MKRLIEKLVRRRNPQFQLDDSVSNYMLFHFAWIQVVALLRGSLLLLHGRLPKSMIRGSGVSFFNLPNICWGNMVKLGDRVHLSAMGKGKLRLGNRVSIGAYSRLVISTSLHQLGRHITIGNRVGIGEYAYLGGGGGLTIGDDCIVGQYFSCHPENHVYSNPDELIRLQGVTRRGIRIGNNCWIGSKVTILDGVSIGEGCVIAAGSVVNKSFPANSVIGGVPARLLRERIERETLWSEKIF